MPSMTGRATLGRGSRTQASASQASHDRRDQRPHVVANAGFFCSDMRLAIVARPRQPFVRSFTGWQHKGAGQRYLVSTSEPSPDNLVEPLTHRNLDGVPYRRDPGVEAQIRAALTLGAADLRARAALSARNDPEYLQEETLAYLIRRANRAADDRLVNDL